MTPAELLNLATKLQEAANMIVATVPNEPEPEPDPEPAVPAWPTAPYVWHKGYVWGREEECVYHRADGGDRWATFHMEGEHTYSSGIRDGARRFAREAVPVTLVPTEAWEAWLDAMPMSACSADRDFLDAVDSLAQEVDR